MEVSDHGGKETKRQLICEGMQQKHRRARSNNSQLGRTVGAALHAACALVHVPLPNPFSKEQGANSLTLQGCQVIAVSRQSLMDASEK